MFTSKCVKLPFIPSGYGVLPVVLLAALAIFSQQAVSKDLFVLQGTVGGTGGETAYFSTNQITNLSEALGDAGLNRIFSTYTSNSAAQLSLSIGGLPAIASYAANSTTLVFEVPSLQIKLNFTGQTRDESEQQFTDFLKGKEGQDTLTRLLQGLVEQSPVSPVAGNPNSLQSTMAASTFGVGTGIGTLSGPGDMPGSEGTNLAPSPGGIASVPNLANAGGDVGFADSDGYKSVFVTLPLRYSYYFSNPQYALTFDLPLTYINTEGAQTGTGSFGMSLRIPVRENWYISPSARVGATGSVDLGAAAIMYSGDITSSYKIFWGDLQLNIGNSFGYYKTAPLDVGDLHMDYDLQNTILKNGLSLEGSLGTSLFNRPG
ncbi:hypothetical protein TI04_05915, partial [Achromatium sp. WMS2]